MKKDQYLIDQESPACNIRIKYESLCMHDSNLQLAEIL